MFYLIYVNSASAPMNDDELFTLLEQSRENNLKLEVTGMLLYKDGSFMQMLEGGKETVLELFERIKQDKRHKNVISIISDDIRQRNFEYWSMGFCNMDKANGLPTFDEYIDQNLTSKTFQDDSRFAYRFMVSFNRNNP